MAETHKIAIKEDKGQYHWGKYSPSLIFKEMQIKQ